MQRCSVITTLLLALCGAAGAAQLPPRAAPSPAPSASAPVPAKAVKPIPRKLDRTGRARVGKASYYARSLAGRRMADGTPMNPHDDNAASKTLPLGTVARVTNLETGRVALVTIQDRGPYVPGRILDVSPGTARQLGIDRHDGVAKVEVAPIVVPQADGTLKLGEGHQDARPGAP
jgi:rare lipoprotein A